MIPDPFTPLLQNSDGGEMVLDFLLIFIRDPPLPPRFWGLFDEATGERWQGGGCVVLDVEPMRMPPLIGGRQTHRRVFVYSVVAQLNAGAFHRHAQLVLLLPLLQNGDGEEVPPQIEVGTNPQKPLTQGDERRNVLDPIENKVLNSTL